VATRSEYQRILNEHLAGSGESAALARHLNIKTQAVSKWRNGHGPGPQYQGRVADYFNDVRLRERTPDPPAELPGELLRELRAALVKVLEVLDRMDS
jgi:23S rRNA G2069 N7-methylase RlmK/C1962 C5-methylase RlmI